MKRKNQGMGVLVGLALASTILLTPRSLLADFNLTNFSSIADLTLNGSAAQAGDVLRLTTSGIGYQTGSGWYNTQQSIQGGFTTVFQFQITNPDPGPADGFAFVIQNSAAGLSALEGTGFGLGYGPGDIGSGPPIENSIAVEFDTFQNGNVWDPNTSHVAVQSCGVRPNTSNHNSSSMFSISNPSFSLYDGNVHQAKITYAADTKRLTLYLDGLVVLQATVPQLNGENAWVGFTGATGANSENHDILSWGFKSGPPQAQ